MPGLWQRVRAYLGSPIDQLSLAHHCWIAYKGLEGIERAIIWAQRGASPKHPVGYIFLGNLYLERNAAGDSIIAFNNYRRAAESGSAAGKQCLAWCFERGVGTEKSAAEALRWYREAADAGEVDAQLAAAKMLLEGSGGTKDPVAAMLYADMAKQTGAPEANAILARLSNTESGAGLSTLNHPIHQRAVPCPRFQSRQGCRHRSSR